MSDFDTNGDGYVDQTISDRYNDGVADVVAWDSDQNGIFETLGVGVNNDSVLDLYGFDTDQNGVADILATDANQDGLYDRVVYDRNEDGIDDASAPSVTYGVIGGGLDAALGADATNGVIGGGLGSDVYFQEIGGETHRDGGLGVVDLIAEQFGTSTWGTPDTDGDGYGDNIDRSPRDPTVR